MFKSLRPDLMVPDVNAAVAFYQEHFDAELTVTVPEQPGKYDFAIIKIGQVELMLELVESLSKDVAPLQNIPMGGSFTLFIEVDDVQAIYDRVKGKVRIVKDMHDTFYGTREFYMQDLNGYVLTLSETKSA